MKDYKLSEIKAICFGNETCYNCQFFDNNRQICWFAVNKVKQPFVWQIDEEEQDDDGTRKAD